MHSLTPLITPDKTIINAQVNLHRKSRSGTRFHSPVKYTSKCINRRNTRRIPEIVRNIHKTKKKKMRERTKYRVSHSLNNLAVRFNCLQGLFSKKNADCGETLLRVSEDSLKAQGEKFFCFLV